VLLDRLCRLFTRCSRSPPHEPMSAFGALWIAFVRLAWALSRMPDLADRCPSASGTVPGVSGLSFMMAAFRTLACASTLGHRSGYFAAC
jgi:hypothetical protein